MTNVDLHIDEEAADEASTSATTLPKRPGLWRVISMVAVLAALILTAVAVLQARSASDVSVADRPVVSLESTIVVVTDLPIADSTEVATLGLPADESRRAFDPAGTEVEIPIGKPAVIALTTKDGSLIGLQLMSATGDRSFVEISARSTARTLIALSPGVLGPNHDSTLRQVDGYTTDPAFDALVDAVRQNPNISVDNEVLETAYAAIADRIQAQAPAADQGCDSVSARNAYPSAGACVQPRSSTVVVTNEQDRWALVYAGVDQFSQFCAMLSPTNTASAEIELDAQSCPGEAVIVAPGPQSDDGENQAAFDTLVRTAAAVNMFYDYAGPFADLAGSSAGYGDTPVSDITDKAPEVAAALGDLVTRSDEFAAAMDVTRIASTAQDRQTALASATRLIIDTADFTTIIPERSPGGTGHLALLDFYARSAERMVSERIDWRWEADAVGRITLGDSQ